MKNFKNILSQTLLSVLIIAAHGSLNAKPCPAPANPLKIPSINPESKDSIDQAILNYAPIVYLAKKPGKIYGYDDEQYFPMTFEYYLAQPQTRVLYGHKKREVVLDKGQVTMQALASIDYEKYPDPVKNLFMESNSCTDAGDNPQTKYITPENKTFTSWEKDSKGKPVIRTPYYAIFTSQGGHDYIQYIFVYGYNGDYPIVPGLPGVGSHKMDVEHLMLQFEGGSITKGTPKLTRISFPAHGAGEAKWLNADNPDLTYEDGHLVAYSAYHGHGLYPEKGTYVRICGFGTETTDAGKKWQPHAVIRVEYPGRAGFDNKKMGIFAFLGDLGPTGVAGLPKKGWFGFPNKEDGGINYKANFCPKGKSCNTLMQSINTCKAPESMLVSYEGTNVFSSKTLPTKEVKVKVGTIFHIFKNSNVTTKVSRSGAKQEKEQKINDFISSMKLDGNAQISEDDDKFTITFTTPGKVHLTFSNETNASEEVVVDPNNKQSEEARPENLEPVTNTQENNTDLDLSTTMIDSNNNQVQESDVKNIEPNNNVQQNNTGLNGDSNYKESEPAQINNSNPIKPTALSSKSAPKQKIKKVETTISVVE